MKQRRLTVLSGNVCIMLLFIVILFPVTVLSAEWPKTITLASAGEGTSQFSIHAGMTTLITKYVGIKTIPEASSIGGKTLYLLHNEEAELAASIDHPAYLAIRGLDLFKKDGRLSFRLLFSGHFSTLVMITRADSGIRSMKDLKGKKVLATHPGNITFTRAVDFYLEAEGMSRADITSLKFFGSRDVGSALKEGRAVAAVVGAPLRSAPGWMRELALTIPVYLFAPAREKIAALLPQYPYFHVNLLPARVYGKMTEGKDLPTLGHVASIYCRTDLPDDLAYGIMKAIFDHKDELLQFSKGAIEWVDNPLRTSVAPYHPGAIKYYKDKGLWTEKLENTQKQLLAEVGTSK